MDASRIDPAHIPSYSQINIVQSNLFKPYQPSSTIINTTPFLSRVVKPFRDFRTDFDLHSPQRHGLTPNRQRMINKPARLCPMKARTGWGCEKAKFIQTEQNIFHPIPTKRFERQHKLFSLIHFASFFDFNVLAAVKAAKIGQWADAFASR